eukprot:GHVR01002623.1.p2 GENE.GHVR01002623.1~~GHVR01002623.1.p2  ORF type:complete len:119 (-),score=16.31 GHVR01002623.1:48-404(-)
MLATPAEISRPRFFGVCQASVLSISIVGRPPVTALGHIRNPQFTTLSNMNNSVELYSQTAVVVVSAQPTVEEEVVVYAVLVILVDVFLSINNLMVVVAVVVVVAGDFILFYLRFYFLY